MQNRTGAGGIVRNRVFSRLGQDRRGASAVEFAMVAPVFLIAVFTVFEAAMLMYASNNIRHAVGEGARYAITNPSASPSTIEALVRSKLTALDPAQVSALIVTPSLNGSGVSQVSIRLDYDWQVNLPLLNGHSIRLSTQRTVYPQV